MSEVEWRFWTHPFLQLKSIQRFLWNLGLGAHLQDLITQCSYLSAVINVEAGVCLASTPCHQRGYRFLLQWTTFHTSFLRTKPSATTPAVPSRRLSGQVRLPGYLQQDGPKIILTFAPKSLRQTIFTHLGVMERKTRQKLRSWRCYADVTDAWCMCICLPWIPCMLP